MKMHVHLWYLAELFLENVAVYELMWRNAVEMERPQMTI
jgi:hypothetical protein